MDDRQLKLTEIGTLFSAQAQKKAEKFPVREVEETEKGHWVAFADDGPESFDVQISIDNGEITAHSCDCGKLDAQGYCLHQLAMLMQLSAQKTKTPKPVTKRKVKEDPLTTLLNQVDTEDLKLWLKEVLQQQKDLAIAFNNRFGVRPVDYTKEEIEKITDAAVRSLVKNKRKIDQSELKKIILLWKEVHEPVIRHYLSNIASVDKIDLFSTLMVSIQKWHLSLNIKSTKTDTYKKEVFAKIIQPLYDIENEEIWKSVISGYFKEGFDGTNAARTDWQIFLSDLVKFETRPLRVDYILGQFKSQYTQTKNKNESFISSFLTQLIFTTYKNAGRLQDCIKWILPISYDNLFNLELIDALLLHGFDDEAEEMCRSIINSNREAAYNFPYLSRLATLFKKEPRQKAKLYPVLLQMLPYSGGLEDYLILKNEYFKNKEEDFKKWRTRIMSVLGNGMRSNVNEAHFYFDILHHEGRFTMMLEKIGDVRTVEVALKYFDVLFAQNKATFLESLTRISAGFYNSDQDDQFYPELAEKVKQHYSDFEIKNVMLKKEHYRKGEFARYFEKTMALR
jgi:hypothetical protein